MSLYPGDPYPRQTQRQELFFTLPSRNVELVSKKKSKDHWKSVSNPTKKQTKKTGLFCSQSAMSELSLKALLTISSWCAFNLYFLNEELSEMGVLKRDVGSHLGPFVLPTALWLHGKRATHPAAVHRHRRRPPPATTCLLPGPPHHWQNCFHRQPWSHAIQHQTSGDPSAAWKQHESHVSALRPLQVHYQSFSFEFFLSTPTFKYTFSLSLHLPLCLNSTNRMPDDRHCTAHMCQWALKIDIFIFTPRGAWFLRKWNKYSVSTLWSPWFMGGYSDQRCKGTVMDYW